jgi:hypothetical protein
MIFGGSIGAATVNGLLEVAGGLGFRHLPFDHRFDDLLLEVVRVRVHTTMLLKGQPHCNTL